VEGLRSIPALSEPNTALSDAVQELGRKETQLRAARQQYSDEFVAVRDLVGQVETLRRETIPRLANSKLDEMKLVERELDQTTSAFSGELRKTPQRAIDEMRAKRDFDVADQFYTSLLSRWNEVRLASEGSTDELKVIDRAVPPTTPSSNSKRMVFASGVFAGIVLAGLLVFLTDLLDGQIRYPEEVEKDLRLRLVARVPMLPKRIVRDTEILVAAQAVEAFRAVRLCLQQAFEGRGCIVIVVTSEGVNEGKSLISANLAMTFAESGVRTLLVDGDLRRGSQHRAYGVPQVPGFTDVLTGRATLQESVRATPTPDLSILTSGQRSRRVPELLDRDKLSQILQALKHDFDVIIIDSAPLGAGVDTYALGTAAGTMLMVLRHGVTNRKAVDGRLSVVDQLPVRIIGAVMNGVPPTKAFASYDAYSYLGEYALVGGDAPQPFLPTSKG
jgi:tyrosine-protein kinase Etk/Wzc